MDRYIKSTNYTFFRWRTNDEAGIDLIAGSNITITPDDANNQITI